MKHFSWNTEKNEKLKAERGVSFEEVVFHIERGEAVFLKTIIPSRKATKQYLKGIGQDEQT